MCAMRLLAAPLSTQGTPAPWAPPLVRLTGQGGPHPGRHHTQTQGESLDCET